ncbi:uncharacterized protein LOC119301922 isoform X2 [Triticum dicoccoides]|uniref:uncharacterized protein LOC119301922 isoform X2 n=1 Tax=Triticum dicoccoides TaxID=85692 RepID=UPI00188FC1EA|nr:uncharacterized protein LOC119301922 isoform X2 [Triticum dicoccoides]
MNPGHLVAGGRSARANLSSAAPRRCPRKSPGGSSIYHLLPHLTSNICLRQRRNIVSLESSGMQMLLTEEVLTQKDSLFHLERPFPGTKSRTWLDEYVKQTYLLFFLHLLDSFALSLSLVFAMPTCLP